MLNVLKQLFGLGGPAVDYRELVKNGATILDVRTKAEYQQGHIKGSVNVPLQNLQSYYSKLRKDKPVITCCASGMRSAQAKGMLQQNGFSEVHNGGGWMSLKNRLN